MQSLELIKPTLAYKQAFQELVWDYIKNKETLYMNLYTDALEDFEGYVHALNDQEKGRNIPKGWVPSSTYWLTSNSSDKRIIYGNLRIRHTRVEDCGHIGYDIRPSQRGQGMGYKILELGLEKAKSIGLSNVFITCNSQNESSIKVVLRNGGLYQRTFIDSEMYEERHEYLVILDQN